MNRLYPSLVLGMLFLAVPSYSSESAREIAGVRLLNTFFLETTGFRHSTIARAIRRRPGGGALDEMVETFFERTQSTLPKTKPKKLQQPFLPLRDQRDISVRLQLLPLVVTLTDEENGLRLDLLGRLRRRHGQLHEILASGKVEDIFLAFRELCAGPDSPPKN